MLKKILAQTILFISFCGLWYIGNLADKLAGRTVDGNAIYTPVILVGTVTLIACAFYLGREGKE